METAFLKALEADPGDVSNRLIFADWLEEGSRCEEAILQRELANAITSNRRFQFPWPSASVHYGITLDEYIVTQQIRQDKNSPKYRRILALWLKFNRISDSNQFYLPRYSKHHLWVADALEGKFGNQVYTKAQVSGKLIKGYELKKAECELSQYRATVAIISRKSPKHMNLAYTEPDQHGYRKSSEIQYLWRIRKSPGHIPTGFLPVKV
jgi:uncharacterized protein (TIGR02996 family)